MPLKVSYGAQILSSVSISISVTFGHATWRKPLPGTPRSISHSAVPYACVGLSVPAPGHIGAALKRSCLPRHRRIPLISSP